jgi:hypothetical protein
VAAAVPQENREPAMKPDNVRPRIKTDAFHCPNCDTYAHQHWWGTSAVRPGESKGIRGLVVAYCERCNDYSLWVDSKMIVPPASVAPMPSKDMPHNVSEDYEEARSIAAASPRSACALLRLALQKLMVHLGEKSENLNDDIGALVKRGLPMRVQQALDVLRVIGNNAVHPGELDLKDDAETATALFGALNMIVDVMITQPQAVDSLYAKLPKRSKEAINKRDSTKPS